MHHHVFSEQSPPQPYDLEFNMAEASVFLCDNASLAVIGWSRDVDDDDDDDGNAKTSHHLFTAYHKTYVFEALKMHKFV